MRIGGGNSHATSGRFYTVINAGRQEGSRSYSDPRGTAAVYGVLSTSDPTLKKAAKQIDRSLQDKRRLTLID